MTYLKKVSCAALLAALTVAFALPSGAQAQDTTMTMEAEQPADQVTAEAIMSAVENLDTELQEAEQLAEVGTINMAQASTVLEGEQLTTFSEAVAGADTDALREFLGSTPALSDALQAAQMSAEDVVAMSVSDDGSVLLVTN